MKATIYQIATTSETTGRNQISALVEKPSAEEIAKRSTEYYDEEAMAWADELLETSSEDGREALDNDWLYLEGTKEELLFRAEHYENVRGSSWSWKFAQQLKAELEDVD